MKEKRLSIAGVCLMVLLVGSSVCVAQDDTAALLYPSRWELGLGASYLNYKEPDLDVKISGPMYEIDGGFNWRRRTQDQGVMFSIHGSLSYGQLEYDGWTMGGTPVTSDSDDYVVDLYGIVGYHFRPSAAWRLSPFAGLGTRYWNDNGSGTGSYEREIAYIYAPVGLEMSTILGPQWSLAARAEFDVFLRGYVKSHLSDVDRGFNDPENEQDSGYGLRASVDRRRPLGPAWMLSIKPFVRYWDVDESDHVVLTYYGWGVGTGYEPANTTTEYGLQVSLLR